MTRHCIPCARRVLAASSGEIRGGMDSFLKMSDYVVRLQEWNNYLESEREKEAALAAAAAHVPVVYPYRSFFPSTSA